MADLVVTGVDLDDLTDRGLLKATLAAVTRMESQMTQMNEALGRLSTAVTEQRDRLQGQIDALNTALEAERAEADRLAQAEATEDVAQDQALTDARAQTDAARAELQSGVESVNQLADQVAGVQGEQPAEPEQPLPQDPASENPENPADPSVPDSGQPVQ